jgi:hypothetical protein
MRIGVGVALAVDGEEVGQPALHQHRRVGEAFALQPLLQLDGDVVVDRVGARLLALVGLMMSAP